MEPSEFKEPQAAIPPQSPNRALTSNEVDQIKKVLASNHGFESPPLKSPSAFWTIFWIYSLPPLGWYMMRKFPWPVWVKALLVVSSIAIYIFAAIETELITNQLTGRINSIDSNLLSQ